MGLEAKIEAVLFYKAEPMKKKAIASFLNVSHDELNEAITRLHNVLTSRGTQLIETDTEIQLTVSSECSELIETLRKDDLKRDIGKAGAEALAIILYRGPLSRAEIDRIRGVNSTFILRNLLVRGLIERREHPTDQRSFVYATTPALLGHLGISKAADLPEYGSIMDQLDAFVSREREREEAEASKP